MTLPQVPVPVFDDSDALITASLPEDLNRFGEGATAAALELAGRDSTTKDVIP